MSYSRQHAGILLENLGPVDRATTGGGPYDDAVCNGGEGLNRRLSFPHLAGSSDSTVSPCMPFFTIPEGCYALVTRHGADVDYDGSVSPDATRVPDQLG